MATQLKLLVEGNVMAISFDGSDLNVSRCLTCREWRTIEVRDGLTQFDSGCACLPKRVYAITASHEG